MTSAMELLWLQSRNWGVELSNSELSLFEAYADLLAEYELANVIGTKNRDKIVLEHLLDALGCYLIEDLGHRSSIIDVGTGAGLPGIPLGIVRHELKVTLLEAVEKKVHFLRQACEVLGLQ